MAGVDGDDLAMGETASWGRSKGKRVFYFLPCHSAISALFKPGVKPAEIRHAKKGTGLTGLNPLTTVGGRILGSPFHSRPLGRHTTSDIFHSGEWGTFGPPALFPGIS